MSEHLAWPRLKTLLRAQLAADYRDIAVGSAIIVGILFIGTMIGLQQPSGDGPSYYGAAFAGVLLIWGTVMASLSFGALHDKARNAAYLLLPASALEKTLVALLLSTVGLIAYLLVLVTIASFAIEGVNALAFGRSNPTFDPLSSDLWRGLPHYIVVQSVFFLGGAWFRRLHYLKTLLACVAAWFAFVVLVVAAAWVAGLATFAGVASMQIDSGLADWLGLMSPAVADVAQAALVVAYFAGVPLFCWYVAWLRVKETQVSHGV